MSESKNYCVSKFSSPMSSLRKRIQPGLITKAKICKLGSISSKLFGSCFMPLLERLFFQKTN